MYKYFFLSVCVCVYIGVWMFLPEQVSRRAHEELLCGRSTVYKQEIFFPDTVALNIRNKKCWSRLGGFSW